jgi:hypothetical protein
LRLEELFGRNIGSGKLELIKDSKDVDAKSLAQDKAFIQVTYVEPYFTEAELRARPTSFERAHNIRRFVFETPYSKGKTGHVSELHKRKTILTLKDNKSFPYMKTRCGDDGIEWSFVCAALFFLFFF